MNLTQELDKYKTNFKAKQPEAIKTLMAQATTDLINSKIAEDSIGKGQKLPNFTLPNAVGKKVTLESLLADGAVVISFYRGGWCPYCNMELRALQAALPEIQARGASQRCKLSGYFSRNSRHFFIYQRKKRAIF